MNDTPQVILQHHLKKLRLPTFLSEYAKLAQQCAAESKDHVQYLLRLCELELIERERRMPSSSITTIAATTRASKTSPPPMSSSGAAKPFSAKGEKPSTRP